MDNNDKIKEMRDIFDKRYVLKNELEQDYATKNEIIEIIGEFRSMNMEVVKTSKNVERILDIQAEEHAERKAFEAKTNTDIKTIETTVAKIKDGFLKSAWKNSLIIRVGVEYVSLFLVLIILTALVGDSMNSWMQKNGMLVAVVSPILPIIVEINRKGKQNGQK